MNGSYQSDGMLQQRTAPARVPWHRSRHKRFLLFTAMLGSLCSGLLYELFFMALRSDYFTYIPFIPVISAALLVQDRQAIFSRQGTAPAAGLLFTGFGTALLAFAGHGHGLTDQQEVLALGVFSSIVILFGGFLLCYGAAAFRAALFPLCFLFFSVPVPPFLMDPFLHALQRGSAEAAYGIIRLAGLPVARDGFVFWFPTLTIEVADECSGIRSALSLIIVMTLAARLFLRSTGTRLLLVVSAVPVAMIKNGLRIAVLSLLGAYVDKRFLAGDLHRLGGIPFFVIALALQGGILWLLRAWERRTAGSANGTVRDDTAPAADGRRSGT